MENIIKSKVPTTFALVLCILVVLALPTNSKVDSFWNSFDSYVRPNIPDPQLKQALIGAELVDVLPTPQEIEFTYKLVDGGQAKITFKMTPDGNLAGVRGEILRENDGKTHYEYSDEELSEIVEGIYEQLPQENLKKVNREKILTGYRYELIYTIPEHHEITYLVACQSDANGEIKILRSQYFSLPPFQKQLLKQISQEALEQNQFYSQFLSDFVHIYPALKDSKILKIEAYFPYFSITLEVKPGVHVQLVIQYNYLTFDMFEISREEHQVEQYKLHQTQSTVIDQVKQDTVSLLNKNHQQVDAHAEKVIVLKSDQEKGKVAVYSANGDGGLIIGGETILVEQGQLVREIIVKEQNKKPKEVVLDHTGKIVEEIIPIEDSDGYILTQHHYDESQGKQVSVSVELFPTQNGKGGVTVGKVTQETLIPVIASKQNEKIVYGAEVKKVQLGGTGVISETKEIKVKQENINLKQQKDNKIVTSSSPVKIVQKEKQYTPTITSSVQTGKQGGQQTYEQNQQQQQQNNANDRSEQPKQEENQQTNCLRFNGNHCIRCFNRYYLGDDGRCKPVQDECLRYNDYSGECYECYQSYVVSFGLCIEIDPLCAKTDFYGECVQCYKNYDLIKGKCYMNNGNDGQVIPLCKVANREGKCIECDKGAFLFRQECKIIDPHCDIFNYQHKECEVCARGFVPDGQVCIRMW